VEKASRVQVAQPAEHTAKQLPDHRLRQWLARALGQHLAEVAPGRVRDDELQPAVLVDEGVNVGENVRALYRAQAKRLRDDRRLRDAQAEPAEGRAGSARARAAGAEHGACAVLGRDARARVRGPRRGARRESRSAPPASCPTFSSARRPGSSAVCLTTTRERSLRRVPLTTRLLAEEERTAETSMRSSSSRLLGSGDAGVARSPCDPD
jgi:hypothetical protein